MNDTVKNITWIGGLAGVLFLMGVLAAGCQTRGASASEPTAADLQTRVSRGQYLVTVAGCNDCHTPWTMGPNGPEPDMTRMLSGHPEGVAISAPAPPASGQWENAIHITPTFTAFSGPWGVSFTANLTPDQNTGLGIWTEDMFIKAIRTGKHFGVSRPILPPMPWPNFAKMTDEDLKSVFAYLRSIPPITNHVPDPLPPVETTH